MSSAYRLLQLALVLFGAIAILLYPLAVVWPSGWAWHPGAPYQSMYFMMIVGIYATLGVFLLNAARKPEANLSLIWFTVASSAVHAAIMAVQSFSAGHHMGHLAGDVPALLLVAIVLAVLVRAAGVSNRPQMPDSYLATPQPVHVQGADGHSVALHDFGGDGPALLFAHATGFHGWAWSVVAQHLSAQFHCWAIDLRGHGDSLASASDDMHFEGFGRDALAVADAIGEPNIVGVGHSLGGAALVLAELARPGTFSELMLYEPGLRPNPVPTESQLAYQDAMVAAIQRRRSRFASAEAALASYARKPPMNTFQAGALAAYVDYAFAPSADDDGSVELKCTPDVEARIVAMTFTHDAAARASALTCPLTQAFGTSTAPVQQQTIEAFARLTGTRTMLPH